MYSHLLSTLTEFLDGVSEMVLDTLAVATGTALIGAGIQAAQDAAISAIQGILSGEWGVGTLREFCTGPYGRVYPDDDNFLRWCYPVRLNSVDASYQTQVALGSRVEGDFQVYLHPAIECLPELVGFPYGEAYRRFIGQHRERALPVQLNGPFISHRGALAGLVTTDGRWASSTIGLARRLSWGHPSTQEERDEWVRRWAEQDLPPVLEQAMWELQGAVLPIQGEVSEPALPFPEDTGEIRNGRGKLPPAVVGIAAAIAAFALFA
jgi:hypothetical protein